METNADTGGTQLLTKPELAEKYRCVTRTIDNWTKAGMPYVPRVGRRLYDPEAVAAWLGHDRGES